MAFVRNYYDGVVVPQLQKYHALGHFIALIKETSVVSFVGAADLYVAFSYIGSNSYESRVPTPGYGIDYIVLVMIIAFFVKMMERSLRKR